MSDRDKYPKIKRLIGDIIAKVESGEYPSGSRLPSLSAMCTAYPVSKDTVYKAYHRLCDSGLLETRPGSGFYVAEPKGQQKNVLIILDKFSAHQQSAVNALSSALGSKVRITVCLHSQDLDLLEYHVRMSLGKYDYYVVFPHFAPDQATQSKVLQRLRKLPEDRLIIIDRLIAGLGTKYGAAYQDIFADIENGLQQGADDFRKYDRLVLCPLSTSLYHETVAGALRRFCRKVRLPFAVMKDIAEPVGKGDVVFVTGSRLDSNFVDIVRKVEKAGLKFRRDIGLICYNDFQINELLLGGLTTLSSDFAQMGREAADMILSGKMRRVHCTCTFIRRNTF